MKGRLDGLVVDALLRPIPGAMVTITDQGISIQVAGDGRYTVRANWTVGDHLVVFSAPGHTSVTRSFAATAPTQTFSFNVTLAATPVGRLETRSWHGLIACGAIVQAGHSHGSGDPDDDAHVACTAGGRDVREFRLGPGDIQDLLLELYWQPNTDLAQRMTLVLRNATGHVVSFDEGTSPLRLHFGRGQIQNVFADAAVATVQVLAGIPEDAPGDVFIGVHLEQPFDLYATTGHGMDVPAEHTVA